MLENRKVMLRLFPELFSRHRVAPISRYPEQLFENAALGGAPPASATPSSSC